MLKDIRLDTDVVSQSVSPGIAMRSTSFGLLDVFDTPERLSCAQIKSK